MTYIRSEPYNLARSTLANPPEGTEHGDFHGYAADGDAVVDALHQAGYLGRLAYRWQDPIDEAFVVYMDYLQVRDRLRDYKDVEALDEQIASLHAGRGPLPERPTLRDLIGPDAVDRIEANRADPSRLKRRRSTDPPTQAEVDEILTGPRGPEFVPPEGSLLPYLVDDSPPPMAVQLRELVLLLRSVADSLDFTDYDTDDNAWATGRLDAETGAALLCYRSRPLNPGRCVTCGVGPDDLHASGCPRVGENP